MERCGTYLTQERSHRGIHFSTMPLEMTLCQPSFPHPPPSTQHWHLLYNTRRVKKKGRRSNAKHQTYKSKERSFLQRNYAFLPTQAALWPPFQASRWHALEQYLATPHAAQYCGAHSTKQRSQGSPAGGRTGTIARWLTGSARADHG